MELAKRLACGRRHIPAVGPPAAERELVDRTLPPAHRMQNTSREPRDESVKAGAQREPGPGAQTEALVPGPETPLELLLAQLALKIRQRNLHGAHDAALIAERGRLRQVERILDADVRRREYGADGPGINPAVGMAADVLVDGTVVHARAATDALQRFAQLRAEERCAAAVHQDEVHRFRAVELPRSLRASED